MVFSQWKSYLTPFSHYYYHYYQTWKFKEEKNIRLKVDHPLILFFLSNQKVNQQKKYASSFFDKIFAGWLAEWMAILVSNNDDDNDNDHQ